MCKKLISLFLAILLLAGCGAYAENERSLPDDTLYGFFDNAMFIGDSITRQLRVRIIERQKTDPACFAGARFYTAQSYMLYAATKSRIMDGTASLKMNGRSVHMYEILEKYHPAYLFILLGVNDYIGEKIEKGIGYTDIIVNKVKQVSPETRVVFQSLTPLSKSFSGKRDLRTKWDKYNEALRENCLKNGSYYLDIASPLKDSDGYLPSSLSSDGRYHLNDDGLEIWLDCLLNFADERYQAGEWTPAEKSE